MKKINFLCCREECEDEVDIEIVVPEHKGTAEEFIRDLEILCGSCGKKMTPELLPCPHCCNVTNLDKTLKRNPDLIDPEQRSTPMHYIRCKTCGMTGPCGKDLHHATMKWNYLKR